MTMTIYNVHIYREMRLYFPGITADTPEQAAMIAADRLTEEAEYTEDCEGDNLAALIDVAGDTEFEHSITIDFEPERVRKAAPKLLHELQYFLDFAVLNDDDEDRNFTRHITAARIAIADATGRAA